MDDCTPGDNCGRAGEAEHVREQKTWPDLWIPTREKWSKDSSSLPSGLEESQHDTFAGRLWVVAMCMEIKGGFFFFLPSVIPHPHIVFVFGGVNTDVEIEGVLYFPASFPSQGRNLRSGILPFLFLFIFFSTLVWTSGTGYSGVFNHTAGYF